MVPPPHMGKEFDSTHNHFLVSGATQLDSGDLEDSFRHITEHGYGQNDTNSQLLVLANSDETELIQGWRAGEESRPKEGAETTGPKAKFSFIPSIAAPPYLTPDNLVGTPAPAQFGGLNVLGSYGPAYVVENNFVPSGYVAVIATNGPGSVFNPVGVRQHPPSNNRA